jgi:hypothetical protein
VSNALKNIRIRQVGIVKAGSINKNDVTTTTVTVSAADSANFLSARLQIVADGSVTLSRRYVNKLLMELDNSCSKHHSPHRAFSRTSRAHYTAKEQC